MSAASSSEGPAPAGLAQGLLELGNLRRRGCLTAEQYALQVKYLVWEFSTPDLPPPSNGANGAKVATATPAVASAAASSVAPAGDGRSPLGDSSECGLNGTSVPLNGAAIGTPRSLSDGVGRCLASPSKEGHPMGAPSTAALTDDGGRPPDPRDHGGPVPGCHSIVPTALFTDLPPSTCDKLVTTIPIALHRETTPVMNNAAASVSTSTGGLLSLTEPIMEIQNREDPTRNRDQPPCSIPPTGRGHPGVCAEPLRLDDGGWFTSPDFSAVASRATAATRPAFSGAPLVVFVVYISI